MEENQYNTAMGETIPDIPGYFTFGVVSIESSCCKTLVG
jgi:hypothetical protein